MAKLNGVTVVSEKITYNGAEYVKTDAAAKVGDIVRIGDEDCSYLTDGGYYEVTRLDSCDDAQITDDDGDEYDTAGLDEPVTVFAKVEAVTTGSGRLKVGELAKVISNGAGHSAKVGDIVRVITDDSSGIPFKCEKEDGDGLDAPWFCKSDLERYVAPAAATDAKLPSALPSNYVIHEGAVYRKESRKAKVGELAVTIADRHHGWPSGVIVKCEEQRYFRSETETTLNGCSGQRTQYLDPHEYAVLVPTDTVTIGGAEYTLEKRKANVGDTVLVVAAEQAAGNYANGTISTIESESCDEPAINGRFLYREEYFVLVPKASATTPPNYREVKRKANVGERIRIVKRWSALDPYENGAELTVNERESDDTVFVTVNGDGGVRVNDREYVVLEEAKHEPVATAKPAPANRLKVGDYAKVTKKCFEYKAGDIVKVAEKQSNGCFDFRVERVGDEGTHYADERFLVRATDEEVAAAKKQAEEAAETAKWAKIGRKVGEFKAGDIVKVNPGSNGHAGGTIGTLVSGAHFFYPREFGVLANGKTYDHTATGFTLVAPVESLFN